MNNHAQMEKTKQSMIVEMKGATSISFYHIPVSIHFSHIRLISYSLISEPHPIPNFDGYEYEFFLANNIRIQDIIEDTDNMIHDISTSDPIRLHPWSYPNSNSSSIQSLGKNGLKREVWRTLRPVPGLVGSKQIGSAPN